MSEVAPERRTLTTGPSTSPALSAAVCWPVSVTTRPDHTIALTVSLTFEPRSDRRRLAVVFVRGTLTTATVADLSGPSGITTVSGIGGSTFSWYIGGFDRGHLPSGPLLLELVVPATARARDAELTLRVDASFRQPRTAFSFRNRVEHGRTDRPWTFPVSLPADPEAPVPSPTPPVAAVSRASVRLCVAADIASYSRIPTVESARVQQRFVELLRSARAHSGIAESLVVTDSSGDGQYAVLPPGLDESVVLPRLLDGLVRATRAANDALEDDARLRIRVAIDRGLVQPSVNGWVGWSTIAIHRLLDSPPLRSMLTQHPELDCAIIVSDTVYQDVGRHGYGGVTGQDFVEAAVSMPEKGFSGRAWLYRPRR